MFLFILIFSLSLFSQCPPDTTGYQVIKDLTICYTKIETQVEYNESCQCYYYTYTITSPPENKGSIVGILFYFFSKNEHPVIDESLPYASCDDNSKPSIRNRNLNRKEKWITPSAIYCPDGWYSIGGTHFGPYDEPFDFLPGQTKVFKIASKFPPGMDRDLEIKPDEREVEDIWWTQISSNDPSIPPYDMGDANPPIFDFTYKVKVVGPVDPEELDLFNGGGQKPDDVNLFLRYANPKQSQTELPSGTDKFDIFIYYGKTIKKETFKATLNDQDIRNLFHPVPGGGDWVKINLQSGRNVLIFSVDGLNQNGKTANDKDQLVLIVK